MDPLHDYLFNEQALSLVFRGKFIDRMTKAYERGKLHFPGKCAYFQSQKGFKRLTDRLYLKRWVVYAKKPIKQRDSVLEYVARYTHRVAISNHRLVSLENGKVTFTYKDRKTDQIKEKTIEAVEFIRRFMLHKLPHGFVKIRHYGFLANRDRKKNVAKIRQLHELPKLKKAEEKSIQEMMLELTGIDISLCPCCGEGKMKTIEEIPLYTARCANDIIRPPN